MRYMKDRFGSLPELSGEMNGKALYMYALTAFKKGEVSLFMDIEAIEPHLFV